MGNEFFKPAIKDGAIENYSFIRKKDDILTYQSQIFKELENDKTFIFYNIGLTLKEISELNFESRYIKFISCQFKDSVLERINDCIFTFDHCQFIDSGLTLINSFDYQVRFENCTGINFLSIKGCENFSFHLEKMKLDYLSIENSENSDLNIYNLISGLHLIFEIAKKVKLKLNSINVTSIAIVNSSFDTFFCEDCRSDGEISINFIPLEEDSRDIQGDFEFKNSSFSKLTINKDNIVSSLVFNKINLINTSNVEIYDLTLNELEITGNKCKNIEFYHTELSCLSFQDFTVEKNVFFKGCKVDGINTELTIRNSILSNMELNPSFLSSFSLINFEFSTISGMIIHNFDFIEPEIISNSKSPISQRILFARELNGLMKEQNNNHFATVYRALELELLPQAPESKLGFFDRLILALNSLSNSHGTRPQKAFILIWTIILVHFIIMSIEFSLFADSLSASNFFWNNISYYFKPFTFITDINFNSYSFSKWFIFFDFLYKISFGYLLYQFIAAFRKFNK